MAAVRTRTEKERRMKETACQRELTLMLYKKELALSLMDNCQGCPLPASDRPGHCRESKCHVGAALEHDGYTIPMRSAWE